jgi:enoyl-CoA hydratase
MLPRAVGKALAMDMVLTGRVLSSPEGLQAGLVSRVAEGDSWLDLAMDVATTIADRPSVAQRLAKNAVQQAYEVGLSAGLSHERSAFAVAFGEPDAREGIAAFLEKRKPDWRRA